MREYVFGGSFYNQSAAELSTFIRNYLDLAKVNPKEVVNASAYVAPHAGYIYSGKTAGFTYRAMMDNPSTEKAETIIIVGPNHTGEGLPIAVSNDNWKTPLGIAENDKELSEAMVKESEYIKFDEVAHKNEHSIEVQIPFLQTIFKQKKYCFICMGDQTVGASLILLNSITNAVKKLNRNVILLASSDLNHYIEANEAKKKDMKILDAAKALNYEKFNELIESLNHSSCGFGPITVAMLFAKNAGAKRGLVLDYSNSGEATGDFISVVSYASMVFV